MGPTEGDDAWYPLQGLDTVRFPGNMSSLRRISYYSSRSETRDCTPEAYQQDIRGIEDTRGSL